MEECCGSQPLAIVEGGRAADYFSRGDVSWDSALGGDDDSVSDGEVTDDADLSGEDDAFAEGGGAGEADLGADKAIGTNIGAVAYLDEVVDFGAGLDAGLADSGAVDAGVGLDFDVVFDDDGAGLEDFVPGAIVLAGEAEAVGTDDDTVLQDDVVADAAELADDGVGVGEEVVSDGNVGVEDNVGKDDGVVADGDVVGDDGAGADVGVGSNGGGGCDDGGGMDAGRVNGRLVEEFDATGECQVGIFEAEGGGVDLGEVGFDEDGGGMGGTGEGCVLGIGDEGDLSGDGGLDAGYTGDEGVRVSMEGGIEMGGEFGEGHGSDCSEDVKVLVRQEELAWGEIPCLRGELRVVTVVKMARPGFLHSHVSEARHGAPRVWVVRGEGGVPEISTFPCLRGETWGTQSLGWMRGFSWGGCWGGVGR